MKHITILGAGIQGICCALALHDEGYQVTLIEKSPKVFSGTSQNQEGRVHMGFTYGLDRSNETGELMMRSALQFSGTMERWLGKINWDQYLLDSGYYAIHEDSLLTNNEVIAYYEKLQECYDELISEDASLSYFGKRPKQIFNVLSNPPASISNAKVTGTILTCERIIEMFTFRDLLVENLEKRDIQIRTSTEVTYVTRDTSGFRVSVVANNQTEEIYSDIVVNCLWNNRIELDKTMGIPAPENPLYRFKIGLFGKITEPVPNCSIIAGAFGNISPRMDGTYAYLSWHVESMRGMTTDGTTPQEWEEYFTRDHTEELKSDWVKNTIARMSEIVPAAKTFEPIKLLPGIICSTGKTDIQDKNSDVHKRASQMGIGDFDGYFSINTGKFSSAPLHAQELVERLKGQQS